MFSCFYKRVLSKIDDTLQVFSLDGHEGYAKITSVYDGDTFTAVIRKFGRVLKFKFRAVGYDSAEMKPLLGMQNRSEHIYLAKLARDMFKEECGFDDRAVPYQWNPFTCKNRVNGWVWVQCGKNDKYGRTLVTVRRNRCDEYTVNEKMIASGIVNRYEGGKKLKF
tara:strand:+ start:322 stop:816 length:495 start_codon:yes stop_codon:yes gene_type:complete